MHAHAHAHAPAISETWKRTLVILSHSNLRLLNGLKKNKIDQKTEAFESLSLQRESEKDALLLTIITLFLDPVGQVGSLSSTSRVHIHLNFLILLACFFLLYFASLQNDTLVKRPWGWFGGQQRKVEERFRPTLHLASLKTEPNFCISHFDGVTKFFLTY